LRPSDTAVTQDGLTRVVDRSPNLREITDGSLPVAALQRLRFLRRASLRGDQITDEATAMLVELPSLEHIELRSPVTDATLHRLSRLAGSRGRNLAGCRRSTWAPIAAPVRCFRGSAVATSGSTYIGSLS